MSKINAMIMMMMMRMLLMSTIDNFKISPNTILVTVRLVNKKLFSRDKITFFMEV